MVMAFWSPELTIVAPVSIACGTPNSTFLLR
jgi:hypothetical protein